MYIALKIISVLILTIIAYLGVQYDFKSSGKLTDWGIFVIILTIVSGFTAIILEIIEHKRGKQDEEERRVQFANLKFQLSKPILPIKVGYFLKHIPPKESVDKIFGERIKSFKKVIDFHKNVGRFFSRDLYGFPFDEDFNTNEYTLCRLTNDELELAEADKFNPIKDMVRKPISFELELFKKNSQTCGLKLRGSVNKGEAPDQKLLDVRLYNNNIYQEACITKWVVEQNNETFISVYDLIDATLKITVLYNSRNPDEFNNPLYFTCFRLICGNGHMAMLEFKLKHIGKPTVKSFEQALNSKINLSDSFIKHIGNPISLTYEINIQDKDFKDLITEMSYAE